MAKLNGKSVTLAVIVSIITLAGSIVWALSSQSTRLDTVCEDVKTIEPEVHENTQGRIQVQADVRYIKETLKDILTEMRNN